MWVNDWSVLLSMGVISALLVKVFIDYEWTEDERINDHAYVDIQGFFTGLCIGGVALAGAILARSLGWF